MITVYEFGISGINHSQHPGIVFVTWYLPESSCGWHNPQVKGHSVTKWGSWRHACFAALLLHMGSLSEQVPAGSTRAEAPSGFMSSENVLKNTVRQRLSPKYFNFRNLLKCDNERECSSGPYCFWGVVVKRYPSLKKSQTLQNSC